MSLPLRVAVYCGSSGQVAAHYRALAREVGVRFARAGITVVYGGGRVGLMGEVADGCLGEGGRVIGVIPHRIAAHEVAHRGLTELIEVDSMHARKQLMVGLSDAVVALPGGFGTLDELFEAVTWRQLGYHDKPVLACDADGYFDALFAFLARAEQEAFVRPSQRDALRRVSSVDALLAALDEGPAVGRRLG